MIFRYFLAFCLISVDLCIHYFCDFQKLAVFSGSFGILSVVIVCSMSSAYLLGLEDALKILLLNYLDFDLVLLFKNNHSILIYLLDFFYTTPALFHTFQTDGTILLIFQHFTCNFLVHKSSTLQIYAHFIFIYLAL